MLPGPHCPAVLLGKQVYREGSHLVPMIVIDLSTEQTGKLC